MGETAAEFNEHLPDPTKDPSKFHTTIPQKGTKIAKLRDHVMGVTSKDHKRQPIDQISGSRYGDTS